MPFLSMLNAVALDAHMTAYAALGDGTIAYKVGQLSQQKVCMNS